MVGGVGAVGRVITILGSVFGTGEVVDCVESLGSKLELPSLSTPNFPPSQLSEVDILGIKWGIRDRGLSATASLYIRSSLPTFSLPLLGPVPF